MTIQIKSDNPSFVLHGIHKTSFDERPVPTIGDDQVLIQIAKTGICGSDVHYLNHGRIGSFVLEQPMCLGHESSGIVVKLGPSVSPTFGLSVGTKVALEPATVCHTCVYCKKGEYNLCPHMTFAATPPYTYGTLCRYYVLPADSLHILPDNVDLEDGAMMEPLSVAVHSVAAVGGMRTDWNVVVFGAGPVGLLAMAVAKALGGNKIYAVDINEERLKFATGYAATDSFLPSPKKEGESTDDYTLRLATELQHSLSVPTFGPGSIDLVIDASGAGVCIATGLHVLRPGGTFVQVGMGPPSQTLPVFAILTKELKFLGSFRYGPGDYPLAISLVSRGLIDLKPLITHRYKFTDALAAFQTTQKGKGEDGKVSQSTQSAHGKLRRLQPVIKCIIDGPE
ncbi:D-xylulose reductase, partial [Tremellales sp. Uapishka_1]